jgi:sortase A
MRKFLVSLIVFVAVGIFFSTLFGAVYYASSDEISLPKEFEVSEVQAADLSFYPVRLTIPKIKVDANIKQVGITKKGNMAAPSNFTDVGWYKYGTIPGKVGSAVIAGHVDDGLALPGVFSNLKDLRKGDDIYITNEKNQKSHFVVSKTTVYDFTASTSEIFENKSGKLLNLITCTGDWVAAYKTHNKRLVVTAILV